MDNNLMYMGIGIAIALGAVYILRRLRSIIFFIALMIVGSSIFSIGPINHLRTTKATENIANTYQGASDFNVDYAKNGGTFNADGQSYQFKVDDNFKTITIMQDGQEVNKINIDDIKQNVEEHVDTDAIKSGIQNGVDAIKSIAPDDVKWPSDYLQNSTQQE